MNAAREFISKVPELCAVKNAPRWSRALVLQYDDELANPDGPFAMNEADHEDIENRLETAFSFQTTQTGKKEHCRNLACILMLAHRVKEHGDAHLSDELERRLEMAIVTEDSYPEIKAAMPAELAARGGWNV